MAEKLWLNANKYAADDEIKFSVCRYGNVCGSAGSVVPVWKKMIAEGATEDVLLDAYPTLKKKDIKAAIVYAADTLAHEETLLAGGRK